MITTSDFLDLAMQCASSVHPDTALEVARVESGFNPYAIAEIIPKSERKPGDSGVISYFPKTKEAALQIVKDIEFRNHRYSSGLMQITSTNFSKYGMHSEDLFSPCKNLYVFEKILTDCYERGKSLKNALSCYYSGDFITGQIKESAFSNTSYTHRIGFTSVEEKKYLVPSVKEAISKEVVNKSYNAKEVIIYPQYAMRGAVSNDKETNDVKSE